MNADFQDLKNRYLNTLNKIKVDFTHVEEKFSGEMHFIRLSNVERPKKYLVFTSGIHGIEGYIGSDMIVYFLEEYLQTLNFHTTGLIIINFINVWGLIHFSRNNENNIDLNRNFKQTFNHNNIGNLTHTFFTGQWLTGNWLKDHLIFYREVLPLLFSSYWESATNQLLRGQYLSSEYPFYGGNSLESENKTLLEWLTPYMDNDFELILLDLHTGIGDYGAMTIILDAGEPESNLNWKLNLGFPNILKSGEGSMYDVSGDFTSYLYQNNQNVKHFSVTVEFGIKHFHPLTSMFSLKNLIFENGFRNKKIEFNRSQYASYFYTDRSKWWLMAKKQFDQGIKGIVKYFEL